MAEKTKPTEPAAPAANPAPPSAAVHAVDEDKQRKTMMMIVVGMLIILLGSSLIAFAVIANSPESRLSKALVNLRDAESLSVSVRADIDDGSGTSVMLSGGSSVIYDPLQLSMNAEVDVFVTKLGVEGVFINDNFYFQVTGLDGVEQLLGLLVLGSDVTPEQEAALEPINTALDRLVAEFDGQWIEVQGSLLNESGADIDAIMSTLRSNMRNIGELDEALSISQVKEEEIINSEAVIPMTIALNPETAEQVLLDIFSGVSIGDQTVTREELQQELSQMLKEYNPSTDTLDVWVEKSTNTLVQARLVAEEDSAEQVITIQMDDYNAVEPVSVPENTITLLEATTIITQLMSDLEGTPFDLSAIDDFTF